MAVRHAQSAENTLYGDTVYSTCGPVYRGRIVEKFQWDWAGLTLADGEPVSTQEIFIWTIKLENPLMFKPN